MPFSAKLCPSAAPVNTTLSVPVPPMKLLLLASPVKVSLPEPPVTFSMPAIDAKPLAVPAARLTVTAAVVV
ncbi:hypothetical protein D3C86_2077970 [compost metagenome]